MTEPALRIENMHKSFGEHEVLKGISMTAEKGDVVAILGASGSGKSTFLRCINLLETPSDGKVWLKGEEMRMVDRHGTRRPADLTQVERMRSKLAMVFQGFNLWSHMTVLENIIEGPVHVLGIPRREARDKAAALLARVGLSDRGDYYPAHLSGGQQQRVAIARALAMEPDVMLFDLPPALLNDDVIAIRPHVDALLIVAAGGTTKASDIKETERRLGENIPLLGVVLNKAEIQDTGDYAY